MIDEEHELPSSRHESDSDGYIYDFFKFQTSLSVLTLAGVFAVSQMDGAIRHVGKLSLVFVMAAVALAGIIAFMGASEVVRNKAAGEPVGRKVGIFMKVAPTIYALGIGGFLLMTADVLL